MRACVEDRWRENNGQEKLLQRLSEREKSRMIQTNGHWVYELACMTGEKRKGLRERERERERERDEKMLACTQSCVCVFATMKRKCQTNSNGKHECMCIHVQECVSVPVPVSAWCVEEREREEDRYSWRERVREREKERERHLRRTITRRKWTTGKPNPGALEEALDRHMATLTSSGINEMWIEWRDKFTAALNEIAPRVTHTTKKHKSHCPWMTPELLHKIHIQKSLYRKVLRTNHQDLNAIIKHRKLRNYTSNLYRKLKNEYFQNCLSQYRKSPRHFWSDHQPCDWPTASRPANLCQCHGPCSPLSITFHGSLAHWSNPLWASKRALAHRVQTSDRRDG